MAETAPDRIEEIESLARHNCHESRAMHGDGPERPLPAQASEIQPTLRRGAMKVRFGEARPMPGNEAECQLPALTVGQSQPAHNRCPSQVQRVATPRLRTHNQ
ncbi:hypothetical protein CCR90_05225 [Rhodovulum sulfidophilum]|nr:hypothetical protein [Rhodovulum sulfidophilum]